MLLKSLSEKSEHHHSIFQTNQNSWQRRGGRNILFSPPPCSLLLDKLAANASVFSRVLRRSRSPPSRITCVRCITPPPHPHVSNSHHNSRKTHSQTRSSQPHSDIPPPHPQHLPALTPSRRRCNTHPACTRTRFFTNPNSLHIGPSLLSRGLYRPSNGDKAIMTRRGGSGEGVKGGGRKRNGYGFVWCTVRMFDQFL
jgi:hypothetical protein